MSNIRTWLVEFIDPKTNVLMKDIILAADKTEARDLFFEENEHVDNVVRITWTPSLNA